MGWQTALQACIAAGKTAAVDQLAYGNSTLTTYKSTMLTPSDLNAIAEQLSPGSGMNVLIAVGKFIAATDSSGLLIAQFSNRGIDLSLSTVQGMLAQAVTAGVMTQALASAILATAVNYSGPYYQSWGLAATDWVQANVNVLANLAAWETMSMLADQIIAAINQSGAVLAVAVATVPTVTAVQTYVANWKTQIQGGSAITGMPTTLAALWTALGA